MVTNSLHIYWMVAFSVHIIRFVLRRSFYPHMRTSYTTNCTGEASDFEQASLDFISLVSCWGKLNEIVYFAGKSLCNSTDDSTNSRLLIYRRTRTCRRLLQENFPTPRIAGWSKPVLSQTTSGFFLSLGQFLLTATPRWTEDFLSQTDTEIWIRFQCTSTTGQFLCDRLYSF